MARLELNETEMMAANGSADMMYNLGMMYCIGRDVEIDLVNAHKWLNLAAMRGSKRARELRCEIACEMSPQEIAAAQRKARNWLELH